MKQLLFGWLSDDGQTLRAENGPKYKICNSDLGAAA